MAEELHTAPNGHVIINGIRINWVKEHYEGFWGKVQRGEWEPETYREIDRHVTAETVFLDLGANIGAITLYAAHKASRVICLEPDPISHAKLLANIQVNPAVADKISVIAKAAHPAPHPIRFGSQKTGGDSMSSAILPDLKTIWTVETLTPSEINAMLPPEPVPVFVKMDIEGGEYDLIPAARVLWNRRGLTLLMQTHQNLLEGFMTRERIRTITRSMFATLRGYEAREVCADRTKRRVSLSLSHGLGLAAPLEGYTWLFTRRWA
jgi:FkbM family methyltransferase